MKKTAKRPKTISEEDKWPDRDDSYSYQNRRRIFGNDADADIETTGGRPIWKKVRKIQE